MIKLQVEDYCQECPYFIPDVASEYPNLYTNDEPVITADKIIVCEARCICSRVAEQVKSKIVHDCPGGIHE